MLFWLSLPTSYQSTAGIEAPVSGLVSKRRTTGGDNLKRIMGIALGEMTHPLA